MGGDSSILINEGFKWSEPIPAYIYLTECEIQMANNESAGQFQAVLHSG